MNQQGHVLRQKYVELFSVEKKDELKNIFQDICASRKRDLNFQSKGKTNKIFLSFLTFEYF